MLGGPALATHAAEPILCDSLCGDYTLLSMWHTCTVVSVMQHFVFLWDCRNRGKSPHYDHQSAVEFTAVFRNTHSTLTPNSPVQATLSMWFVDADSPGMY